MCESEVGIEFDGGFQVPFRHLERLWRDLRLV